MVSCGVAEMPAGDVQSGHRVTRYSNDTPAFCDRFGLSDAGTGDAGVR